ncbi:MAG: 2-oxo-hept-4-ene-1,7-dioate hydratase [Alphaproteobacteria bacterium]
MMEKKSIAAAVASLEEAEKSRTFMRQLTREHPGMTIEDAYAIQHAWLQLKLGRGRTVKGRKIGLTSKVMQRAVNIDEPDYGFLLDDMFFHDGSNIPTERFIQPKIEMELAFVLSKRLAGPGCTIFDALNATDYVVPALEILDARIERVDRETKATRKIVDGIADNASDAGIVTGGRPFKPLDVDLRWIGGLCSRNGQVEETGIAAAVLNHPANGIAWLANKLAPHGIALEPGLVILSGSFIRPIDVKKGDTIHADYGPFGAVSCYFA